MPAFDVNKFTNNDTTVTPFMKTYSYLKTNMNTQYASTFFAEGARTCTGTQFLFFHTQKSKIRLIFGVFFSEYSFHLVYDP